MRQKPTAQWLSISAYARAWGLTRNTVYKLLENKSLDTYRVLTQIRIRNLSPDQHRPKSRFTS